MLLAIILIVWFLLVAVIALFMAASNGTDVDIESYDEWVVKHPKKKKKGGKNKK